MDKRIRRKGKDMLELEIGRGRGVEERRRGKGTKMKVISIRYYDIHTIGRFILIVQTVYTYIFTRLKPVHS